MRKHPKRTIIVSFVISVVLWAVAFVVDKYSLEKKVTIIFLSFLHSIFNFVPGEVCIASACLIMVVAPLISYILICIAYRKNLKKSFLTWATIPTNWVVIVWAIVGVGVLLILFGYGASFHNNRYW